MLSNRGSDKWFPRCGTIDGSQTTWKTIDKVDAFPSRTSMLKIILLLVKDKVGIDSPVGLLLWKSFVRIRNPCVLSRRDSTDMKSASVSIRVLPDKGSWEHLFPESPPLTPPSAPRSPSAPTCFSSWLCSSCPPTLLPLTLKSPQMLPRRHELSS